MEYRIQKVAYLHQKEKKTIAEIDALNTMKSNLRAKSNLDKHLLKIEYNLQ